MELIQPLANVAFYGLMAGILVTAGLCVHTRNMFHSAIFLAFTLIGVAIAYFFLHAEFIAAIQILLYVGAIMTLVIFAIMLTTRIQDPKVPQTNRQRVPALLILSGLAGAVIYGILKTEWRLAPSLQSVNAVELGRALMGTYVFPFEIVSIVLLAALIGAIVIARSDR